KHGVKNNEIHGYNTLQQRRRQTNLKKRKAFGQCPKNWKQEKRNPPKNKMALLNMKKRKIPKKKPHFKKTSEPA
ncbi:11784_t:CDS:2, partial [Gigaspora rosea]